MPAVANLNQNASNVWSGNNVQVKTTDTQVMFKNHASNACAITFGGNMFGISSTTIPANTDTPLPIVNYVATTYTLPGAVIAGPQYTIAVDTTAKSDYQTKTA